MRLQTQITIAFTTLLVIIMSVVAIMIYSLILDVLIQNEQDQLEEKGEILIEFLLTDANPESLSQWLGEEKLQLFIYDRDQEQTLLRTLPQDLIDDWLETYDLNDKEQSLWIDGDDRYVVSVLPIFPDLLDRKLVLITPLNDLQEVQNNFFSRLIIVFLIGIMIIVLFSHFLTKRLVTPLTKLKHQLKKIENRQFDDVERVIATGEIKEVEQSVNDMAVELQRYINSQRQFFQNASHELKTPLMTIQGYAEGIRDGIFVGEESDRGLGVMVDEVARLKKIINEMILLAKLDSEENIYKDEFIKIDELITLTVERALPMASEKNVKLKHEVDANVTLYADHEKLLRAMMNIVTNGIRHANKQVVINVNKTAEHVELTVEDDGEGISEDLMPKLFQRFIKGEGGETGLGLAISRAIVERSNGTIAVSKSSLGGALFTIRFKL
ncbi:sensor histidine kinase [Paraliobacillus zengyii]|uniref:sensor histidine kinase n=1 Tax=Paraliobacillus zengyii TaxID=2213194 RepID=UPI000DD3B55A|nr:HAMP domain-containing sensor histidine kinase [Paraliobacillus zengyii]